MKLDLTSLNFTTRATSPAAYERYAELRATQPVLWSEQLRAWVLTRYREVEPLLKDPRLVAFRPTSTAMPPVAVQSQLAYLAELHDGRFFRIDPPAHTRLRKLVSEGFTPSMVQKLQPQITGIAHQLIDQVVEQGQMEVVGSFAYPLPVLVIGALLGLPTDLFSQMTTWSKTLLLFFGAQYVQAGYPPAQVNAIYQIHKEMADYLGTIIQERRRRPQEDLLSALVTGDSKAPLSDRELISLCIVLLFAGHETTMNTICNGLWALLRHPDQQQKMVEQPALIPAAVEEMLRYDAPVQFSKRTVASEFALGEVTLRAGDVVWLGLGAANRDPAQFSEPDCLRLTRSPNRHLAFGTGIHFCLGAPLARLEGQIAFKVLGERLCGLQLVNEPSLRQHSLFRGVEELQVTWQTSE